MGMWLRVNGEAVYGTRPGPFQEMNWCRSTVKPGKIYLHVFDWPENGDISLPAAKIDGAYLLSDASRAPLSLTDTLDRLHIQGPSSAPDPIDTVIVLLTNP